MKGEGGPLSLPPGLLALLLGLPSSSLALSSVLGGPEPQFPLPGTPSAVGGPSSSLPWPGRWEPLWGRGSSLLGFPRPLASRKSALGEGNLAPFSQTKVQGRRLGTPADLYSSGSGFRPQRPRKQPQVRVGTSRRHWRAVGGDLHHPKLDSAPQAVEQWGGVSLDVSPLRAGCVCQAGVAWAQSLDKGLQQRRLSPVGSWAARSRAVCPPPACPGPDTSRNQRQERRCLEAFLWCLSLPSRGCG